MKLTLIDLNDDVLRRICDFLSGKDALHFSLAAKHPHNLAITRVGVSLTRHSAVLTSASRDDLISRRENELVQILDLLVELLSVARNLRSLTLHAAHALLHRSNHLGSALAALPHLQHLTLAGVSDTVVKFLGETSWDLRTLNIDYLEIRYDRLGDDRPRALEEQVGAIPVLHNTLARFHNLHTLKITHFEFAGWNLSGFAPTRSSPIFPRIRRLFLANNIALFIEVARIPGTVDHLQITDAIFLDLPEDENEYNVEDLLRLLERMSPVYAQLSVIVRSQPMNFWGRVAACAPRLRYLELQVSMDHLDEERAGRVDNVPEALRPLSLVYLRLQIVHLPDRRDISHRLDYSGGDPIWNVTEETARAMYHERYVAVQTLAERCARAIPTLKYFVLCDDGPKADQCAWHGEESGQAVSGDDCDADSLLRVERAEELGQLDPCCSYWRHSSTYHLPTEYAPRPQTWRVWREEGVEGQGQGLRLEKLTHGQGRELYRTLVSTFDGRNEALTESTLL
ncbi:hypothetical protein C8Q76DRAFT_786717 [Earliella scabrosa]|nr:hypothetical protein C8Q76DRAFT_786717 [Earliella scabrosa]